MLNKLIVLALAMTSAATFAAGEYAATQTGTINVYTIKSGPLKGSQVGGSATTTVTGGVGRDGHGNIIPNGTVGSRSSTVYGPTLTIPISGKK